MHGIQDRGIVGLLIQFGMVIADTVDIDRQSTSEDKGITMTRSQSRMIETARDKGYVYLENSRQITMCKVLVAMGIGTLSSVVTKRDGSREMCSRKGIYFILSE